MPSEEGFYKPSGGSTTWINIINAKDKKGVERPYFAEKAAEGDKDAVSRINKNKDVVWEKHYRGMGLFIKAVYIKDGQFGKQLLIRGKSKTLQVPFSSTHATQFIAKCRNLDLNQLVGFEPYRMIRKDQNDKVVKDDKGNPRYNNGWTIKQGGTEKENKVENELDTSKDGPVPAMRKLKNGKWDSSDRDEYLEEYLTRWIKENDLGGKPQSEDTEEDDEETDRETSPLAVKKRKKKHPAEEDDNHIPF